MKTKSAATLIGSLALALSACAQGGYVAFGDGVAYSPSPEQRAVRPVSAPYFHEDSFVTTDLRAWYLKHHFYGDTIGGNADVYALQIRAALTERLQLVAYKDGYMDFNGGALGGSNGWNDLAAGLKWVLHQDWEQDLHVAVGAGYELSVGDREVLQDTNVLRLWTSANKGFGRLHLGGTLNYLVADGNADGALGSADLVTAHLHADYRLSEWFSPVAEVNGYFVTSEGSVGAPFSGVDGVSIGGGEGEETATAAIGGELRPFGDAIGVRAAYETQLGGSLSLFGHRWTVSVTREF